MAVNIGDKPLADFTQPIEMMKDCHRRIEHFLDVLREVEQRFGGGELNDEGRRALEASLEYFGNFAPRHTADEEQSLFPRLRRSGRAESCLATATLDRLDQEHQALEGLQTVLDRLAHDWLTVGHLNEGARSQYRQLIGELARTYIAHIRQEEERVYPLAARILQPVELRDIATEMRRRRSLAEPPADHTGPAASTQT